MRSKKNGSFEAFEVLGVFLERPSRRVKNFNFAARKISLEPYALLYENVYFVFFVHADRGKIQITNDAKNSGGGGKNNIKILFWSKSKFTRFNRPDSVIQTLHGKSINFDTFIFYLSNGFEKN